MSEQNFRLVGHIGKLYVGILVCRASGKSDKWNYLISLILWQVRRCTVWTSHKFHELLLLIETASLFGLDKSLSLHLQK